MKTIFVQGTTIEPEWLNEVDEAVFDAIGDGAIAPTTPTEVRTNISAAKSGANSDITSLSGLTTPLSLSQGGTGSNLSDPGADRIVFWDESDNLIKFLTVGTNLLISGTTLTATGDVSYADTRFSIGSFTRDLTTASGTQAVTGVGFAPTAVIFGGGVTGGAFGASVGVATASGNFGTWLTNGAGFYPQLTTSIFCAPAGLGDYQTGAASSLDADGFTITWAKVGTPTGTGRVWYLALR